MIRHPGHQNPTATRPPDRRTPHRERLQSWKEIAAYLGRAVRTCQRWEQELGLPIHRGPKRKRDILFAYPEELDAWLERHQHILTHETEELPEQVTASPITPVAQVEPPAAPPALSDPSPAARAPSSAPAAPVAARFPRAATVALAASLLALAAFGLWNLFRPSPVPALWELTEHSLHIRDSSGRPLWKFDFEQKLEIDRVHDAPIRSGAPVNFTISDLDGDSRPEVLLISPAIPRGQSRFYCFEADGRVRFSRQFNQSVRFGNTEYLPPLIPAGFVLTDEPDGRKTIWLHSEHNLAFPALLEKLSPTGEVLGSYWSNGHISFYRDVRNGDRRLLLLGAQNNELDAASLAFLDYDRPSGFAPAANPAYLCQNCSGTFPLAFFVFPKSAISRLSDSRPVIDEILLPVGNRIGVSVSHPMRFDEASMKGSPKLLYSLSLDGNLLSVEPYDAYRSLFAHLRLNGLLKSSLQDDPALRLDSVRRWDGNQFVSAVGQKPVLLSRHSPRWQPASSDRD